MDMELIEALAMVLLLFIMAVGAAGVVEFVVMLRSPDIKKGDG